MFPLASRAAAALAALVLPLTAAPTTPAGRAAASAARSPAVASPGAVASAPGAGRGYRPSASPRRAGPRSALTLINGDRVLVTGSGSDLRAASVLRAPGSAALASSLIMRALAGGTLMIPVPALPYLGRGLDPHLFDLGALERAEHDGKLPVVLRHHGTLHIPPGIIVTHSDAGTAEGYLTAASAPRFGAALARQFRADHARGHYGQDGTFAGGLSISLPGIRTVSPRPRPAFPMHTLTVTGTGPSGKPDTGDVVTVLNVNNLAALGSIEGNGAYNVFYHGTAKFSVPAGTYWAVGNFVQFLNHGHSTRVMLDVLPQFTVHGDATVHLSASAATSKITMVTPRSAVPAATLFSLYRFGPHGPCSGQYCQAGPEYADLEWGPAVSTWVSPVTRRPGDGILRSITYAELSASPGGRSVPYGYDLNFAGPPGTIPRQRYVVRPASLATLSQSFYQDVRSARLWAPCAGTAFQLSQFALICPQAEQLRLPGRQTEYLSTGPTYWSLGVDTLGLIPLQEEGGGLLSHKLRAGQRLGEIWNRYPLHPAANATLPRAAAGSVLPSAARARDELTLDITPFSDNTPGHTGAGFHSGFGKLTGTYRLEENSKLLKAGNAVSAAGGYPDLFVQARLPHLAARIRLVLNASWRARLFRLSGTSHDVWTWRTRRQPHATVPRQWYCIAAGLAETRNCAVQPMIMLRYQVAGLNLAGTARPGRQVIGITASHLPLAASPRITGTWAWVSFNSGKAWHRARVNRLGMGRFRAVFRAPAGRYVTLRVTARDAAGNTVAETITHGYQTASGMRLATLRAATRHGQPRRGFKAACPAARPGHVQCLALYRPQIAVNNAIAAGIRGPASEPSGWSPQAVESAYKLPISRNSHQTVAVSIAFGTPKLAHYLAVYRRHYHLPPCTIASGCLRIVNQRGNPRPLPPPPSGDAAGWMLEATLDVSMISAACPHCHILVVEANDDTYASLATSENTAARLGAAVISNSYGARENGFAQSFARDYDHPGHIIVAASGDEGFTAAEYPANLASVTAVGGTQLRRAHNARGWSEKVWNQPLLYDAASSSGCSAYVAKPAWQHDRHCSGRTVADVAAVATNIPVYNSDFGGWVTVAGTSIAAPLIAGIYGLAGNAATVGGPAYLYSRRRDLYDVISGSNALGASPQATCGGDYLCTAKPGYDAPTGLGTPDGTGAF